MNEQCQKCQNRGESSADRRQPHCRARRGRPSLKTVVIPPEGCPLFQEVKAQ